MARSLLPIRDILSNGWHVYNFVSLDKGRWFLILTIIDILNILNALMFFNLLAGVIHQFIYNYN